MGLWNSIKQRLPFAANGRALYTGEEQTGAQTSHSTWSMTNGYFQQQYAEVPPKSIRTYREMREYPTIALARAAAWAPVMSSGWSYEAKEGIPTEYVAFIRDIIEKEKADLLRNLLFALDYGFKPFEKVLEVVDGGKWGISTPLISYRKLKPLAVEKSEAIEDKYGNIVGVRNGKAELSLEYSAWFTYDAEDNDSKGRARHENIRAVSFALLKDTIRKMQQYALKVAGAIPIIEFPPGEELDATGATKSNYEIAKSLAAGLSTLRPILMPNSMANIAAELFDRGVVDPSKFKAWNIDFLKTTPGGGTELLEIARFAEVGCARGWLVPERAILEGQYGTKAEAGAHGDVALSVSGQLIGDIVQFVNDNFVNPLLLWNFGPEYVDTVFVKSVPLVDEALTFLQDVVGTVLKASPMLVEQWIDIDAALDRLNLPKLGTIIVQDANEDSEKQPSEQATDELARVTPASVMAMYADIMRRKSVA